MENSLRPVLSGPANNIRYIQFCVIQEAGGAIPLGESIRLTLLRVEYDASLSMVIPDRVFRLPPVICVIEIFVNAAASVRRHLLSRICRILDKCTTCYWLLGLSRHAHACLLLTRRPSLFKIVYLLCVLFPNMCSGVCIIFIVFIFILFILRICRHKHTHFVECRPNPWFYDFSLVL